MCHPLYIKLIVIVFILFRHSSSTILAASFLEEFFVIAKLLLRIYFIFKASLDEPVQKTLVNVKKTLGSPEERKHQTNERRGVQPEWFKSPDNLKVSKIQLCIFPSSNVLSSRLRQFCVKVMSV